MRMVDPANLETLGRAECLTLLSTATVGRVVFTDRALPAVRPVRFSLHEDQLWLEPIAGDGPITETPDAELALEADHIAPDLSDGWFV